MDLAYEPRLTPKALLLAAAVVVAGLAAAIALASARQQSAPSTPTATLLTAPTLATKAHGRAKPATQPIRHAPR
jgi:hypothetical protein